MFLKIQKDLPNLTKKISNKYQTKMEIGILEEIRVILVGIPYRFSLVNNEYINDYNGNK